jgi:predicted unusual protein kinase regulating ubiquinone biosynthesis (AarF/ABC1/UbiB family)
VFPDRITIVRVPRPADVFEHPYAEESWLWRTWFTVRRCAYLLALFLPCLGAGLCSLATGDEAWRARFLELMVATIERAGCSFQKFAQWMSMRPDMFSADTIEALSKMRDGAPSHGFAHTRRMIRQSFGRELEEIFERFDETPVASGTVAQVHRARLRPEFVLPGQRRAGRGGAELAPGPAHPAGPPSSLDAWTPSPRDVAVKVRHPSVLDETFVDIPLLFDVCRLVPSLTMPFDEADFTQMLQRQFDFKWEAYNLVRFAENFRREIAAGDVFFPEVSPELLSSTVLVESWVAGSSVANIFEAVSEGWSRVKEAAGDALQRAASLGPSADAGLPKQIREVSTQIARSAEELGEEARVGALAGARGAAQALGLDAASREAHAALVEAARATEAAARAALQRKQRQLALCIFDVNIKMMLRDNLVHGDLHAGNLLFSDDPDVTTLTVIDAGVTTSLSDDMRAPFMGFLYSMCVGDFSGMARRIVQFAEPPPEGAPPHDVAALEATIEDIAAKWVGPDGRSAPDGGPVSVGDLMGNVLFSLGAHGVTLRGDVASSLVTISISEGLIRQLDPEFDMMKAALPYFITFQDEIRALAAEDDGRLEG